MKLAEGVYFGRALQTRRVADTILTEKIHPVRERLPEHEHTNAYFCLALSGSWTEWVGTKKVLCRPRQLVYHPPGEVHQTLFSAGSETRTFNLEITPACASRLESLGLELPRRRVVLPGPSEASVLDRVYREFRRDDRYSALSIEATLLEQMVALVRHENESRTSPTAWVEDLQLLIQETCLDPLTLSELAHRLHRHPVTVSRGFHQATGQTITEAYRQCRLQAAARLLRETRASLVEVALETGFFDQSHFGRAFRRAFGTSPLRYRQAHR